MLRWLRLKFKRQTFPDGIKQNAAGKVSFEEFWGTTPYGVEYYDGFTGSGHSGLRVKIGGIKAAVINSFKDDIGGYRLGAGAWSLQPRRDMTMDTIRVRLTAIIHTHWHPTGELGFSVGDIKGANPQLKAGYSLNHYLVNRRGEVKYMKPNADKTNYGKTIKPFKIK